MEQLYDCFMLQQWFSNGRAAESLGETGQPQIYGSHSDPEIPDLEHRGWGLRICISKFLTGSQVMLMLQVQGPHLENHCMTAFCSEYGGGGAGNGQRRVEAQSWNILEGHGGSELGICGNRGCLLVIAKSLPLSLYSFSDALSPKNANNTLYF